MFIFVTVIVGLSSLGVVFLSKKGIANLSGAFIVPWLICLSFASLSLFGMQELAPEVKIIGVLVMPIFAINAMLFPSRSNVIFEDRKYHSFADNSILIFLNLIIYVISIKYLVIAITSILNGNIYWLRAASYEANSAYMSSALLSIYQTIFRPLLITMIILTSIDYSRNCGKKKTLLLSIGNVALYSLLFAGRYMIFESLIIVFAAFYQRTKRGLLSFIKSHKKLTIIGVIGVLVIIVITNARTQSNFLRSLYTYFCGSFGYLTTLINNNIGLNLNLYGRAEFGFIYNTLWLLLSMLGIVPRQGSASYQITQLTGTSLSIGGTLRYNSLATFLHPLMADYGKWGCLFGVFLFAFLINAFEKKRNRNESTFLTAIYIELVYVMINCVLTYSLLNASFGFLFLYLFLFTHKFKVKK